MRQITGWFTAGLVLALVFAGTSAAARAEYGLALGASPKYPAGFSHFEYVNPAAPKGGSITLSAPGRFDSLNPYTLKGNPEVGMALLTMETLAESSWDEPFAMYGLLADDIAPAADGLSVRFHLNPKARFHNGEAVLAEDVVFSFKTLTQDPAAAPMFRFYWADVAAVNAVDSRTVIFTFKRRNAELAMILGQLPVFSHKSFPKGLAEAANTAPIGSGPYRLVRTADGRLSEYRRDPDYWGKHLPVRRGMFNFDSVRYKYYLDETARVEALKAHDYDVVNENVARLWARAYTGSGLAARGLHKTEFAHRNNAGMQGFVFNLRRDKFKDRRVRQALGLAFDFETVNRMLFYGQYRRSNSFFTNSELAASGLPEGGELALLTPLKAQLPPEVLTQTPPQPPVTDPQLGVRPNLIRARDLLLAAGYRYQGGRLVDAQGRPLQFEFLSYSKTFERATAKWQRDLDKIGVTMTVRVVDAALYQKRVNDFDYDMTVVTYANSQSPGNEQADMYSCAAAQTPGSQNYAGICDPAIEALLPKFIQSTNRADLVAASRALDRVLLNHYLLVPNWYSGAWRMVYWDGFRQPETLPLYYEGATWAVKTWWRG